MLASSPYAMRALKSKSKNMGKRDRDAGESAAKALQCLHDFDHAFSVLMTIGLQRLSNFLLVDLREVAESHVAKLQTSQLSVPDLEPGIAPAGQCRQDGLYRGASVLVWMLVREFAKR